MHFFSRVTYPPVPTVAARRRRRQSPLVGVLGNETSTILITNDGHEFLRPEGTDDSPKDDMENEIDPLDNTYIYFYQQISVRSNKILLHDLRHFGNYKIEVKACREGVGANCSQEIVVSLRTARIEKNDNINDVEVERLSPSNSTNGQVRVKWSAPKRPNGRILSYTIRYQRVDVEHSKFQEVCISQMLYIQNGGEHILRQLDNGNYSFTVMAMSLAGAGAWSEAKWIFIDESHLSNWMIFVIVTVVILVLLVVAGFLWFFYQRRFGAPVRDLKLIASVNPEYVSMQYRPDEWEVPRENIVQLCELGQGSFGMVYQGIVKELKNKPSEIPCAIKTVNDNATDRERINFLKEAGVMKAFDTHHVVRLLGVVSNGQPTLVIMELMANGDLKGYLRSHRPEAEVPQQPPSLKRILQMAIEIADGMAYLSAKKFVHRDLAARNCMVADDLTVKIGDFGMTRDIYETDYYRKGTKGLLPVRWMAPESLKDGIFSSSSDVFSFGVVLWEMATLASQPYQVSAEFFEYFLYVAFFQRYE